MRGEVRGFKAGARWLTSKPCHGLHPHHGAVDRKSLLLPFLAPGARLGEFGLGPRLCGTRALDIDLFGALRNLGENDYAVGQNLRIAVNNRQVARLGPFAIRQDPDAQLGNQRSMSGQNAEISFLPGYLDRLYGLLQHVPLRRDHLKFDGFR